MKAMIFAAGLGTRLYPITKDRPKALAPFHGTTLLHYNLRFLAEQGVDEFVINTHHFAEEVESYLYSNEYFGLNIQLSYEKELLNTAGGIAHAAQFLKDADSPILFYNVDVVSNISLRDMLMQHQEKKNDITLAMRDRETQRYLLFDEADALFGWMNKATGEKILKKEAKTRLSEFAFSGIQLMSPEVISLFSNGRIYSLIDFYLENMDKLNIGAYGHDHDYWYDCGKTETLRAAEEHVSTLKDL